MIVRIYGALRKSQTSYSTVFQEGFVRGMKQPQFSEFYSKLEFTTQQEID
jgi:hypothetical protein